MELIKLKNLEKFESALKEKYLERLVKKYFFIPSEEIDIIDSLDDILDRIQTQKIIDEDANQFLKEIIGKLRREVQN